MAPPPDTPLCPVIAGPTAVGKTALITALAARHPMEVVSLDSRQIYRGLRIGTAQPTAEEQAACRHHLVDFLPPEATYSAQRFRADFVGVAGEIMSRGKVPVLVGGAGLYLTAVREGLLEIPDDAPDLAPIRAELDVLDDAEIRARLLAVDPDSHARLHANDRYRNQRALEIHRLTGRSLSAHMAARTPDPALGLDFPLVVLERDRDELRARIAARTDAMLAGGWLEETRDLLSRHDPDAPGLRTLGYRELQTHLTGGAPLSEAREAIVVETARYAKRQRTWFAPQPRVAAGRPDDPALLDALSDLIRDAAARLP